MPSYNLRQGADGRRRANDYLSPIQQVWAYRRELEELNRKYRRLEIYTLELRDEVEDIKDHNDRACKAVQTAHDSKNHLEQELERKDEEIHALHQEIVRYKSTISSSNLRGKQMSDTTIKGNMDALFFALRDWAVGAVRQGNMVFDAEGAKNSFLSLRVPRVQEDIFARKVQAVIATFSEVLVKFCDRDFVFGLGSDESYKSATQFYRSFTSMSRSARQRKKQWVLLTNDILSENPEAAKKSAEETLDKFINTFERVLSDYSNSTVASNVIRKLKSTIQPHMATIYSLDHQEADYFLELPIAVDTNGSPKVFNAAEMEDVNGGDAGMLESSFFPLVYKQNLQDPEDYIIVCKAKVALVAPEFGVHGHNNVKRDQTSPMDKQEETCYD